MAGLGGLALIRVTFLRTRSRLNVALVGVAASIAVWLVLFLLIGYALAQDHS